MNPRREATSYASRMVRGGTSIALLTAGTALAGCGALGSEFEAGDVDAAAQAMVDDGAVAVVVDVRDGDAVTSLTLGEADLASGREPQPDDPARAASITKTAVAITVLRLAEDGELGLDDPVADHLPGLLEGRDEVTVRQLLNHTSGLPDYTAPMYADLESVRSVQHQTFTETEHVASALEQDWLAEPGTEFNYSNTNYVVLGLLIAEVTGEDTADVIGAQVLEPAGMHNTAFPDGPSMPQNALRGYLTVDGDRLDMTEFDPSVPSWGASMVSTAPDISAMMQALNGCELLSEESLEQMRDAGESGYGLGIMVGPDPCDRSSATFGQRGNGFGYNTYTVASADGSRVVTVTWTGGTEDPGSDPLLPASQELATAALAGTCPD